MPAAILSQDILVICLVVSEGDINLSIEEVISRVENYQEVQNRHFGISKDDFRNLFYMFVNFELGIRSIDDGIDNLILSDIITDILKYQDVYFNDEGEYWTKRIEVSADETDYSFIETWYSYDKKETQMKVAIRQKMKEFFQQQEITALKPKSVKKFMDETGITDDILYQCSQSGESS